MFTGIQNSHVVPCQGYETIPFNTGYEKVMANRVDSTYASTVKQDGTVSRLTDSVISVVYKDGTEESFKLGTVYGTAGGATIPHAIVAKLGLGDQFLAGDVIAYNTGFFGLDLLNPRGVTYKAGKLVRTAFLESADTDEDGNSFSKEASQFFTTPSTAVREIVLDFDDGVTNLVQVGDVLETDSILCTITNSVGTLAENGDISALQAIQEIAALNPKAKQYGTVGNIEVLYYGKEENMSPTIASIVTDDNKRRTKVARDLNNKSPKTGFIDDSILVGGTRLTRNQLVIKIYINYNIGLGTGDKLVFGNQLKTTISIVTDEPIHTEDGKAVHAKFGYQSVSNRIVESPMITGATCSVLLELTKQFVKNYRG